MVAAVVPLNVDNVRRTQAKIRGLGRGEETVWDNLESLYGG